MKRSDAFAELGVPNLGRRQWNAPATDGTQVLSVWHTNLADDGSAAEAHVHKKDFGLFVPGVSVRVVIQRGERDAETGNMSTVEAYPCRSGWTVTGKEIRPVDHPNRIVLHVVSLRREDP